MNKFVWKKLDKEDHLPEIKNEKRIISCASCEKELVESVEILEIPQKRRYKFLCPYCGDSSFIQEFEHKASFMAINCKITHLNLDEERDICLVSLEQKK